MYRCTNCYDMGNKSYFVGRSLLMEGAYQKPILEKTGQVFANEK